MSERNPILTVHVSLMLHAVSADETPRERLLRESSQARLDQMAGQLQRELGHAIASAVAGEPFDVSVRIRL